MIFDEELPKAKTALFPRNLETMSVSELEAYIAELNTEIERVCQDKSQKKASQGAAESFFKA